ncbi:uncharacterized protein LOC106668082 isoform X2 [Cimex lectularius]|uniref:Ig-like domain-containing protein n=1 Tax=Cimex lectularius TaxID=79782 RepID=A0A8I6SHX2_CIMLE|nr:uncharacterized protein LOC106668082 isoform X2 [Cimex lectularius]
MISNNLRTLKAFYKYEKDDDSIPPKIKTDPIMWISKLPQINQNLNKETSKIQLCESKSDCEKSYKVKCICSLFDMINKINTIIINSNNQKELLERISNLSCHNYIPITVEYKIPTAMNPRLIYTKRKELVVDAETGPKEISDSTIKQLLKRSIPNEGVDFYAFASSNIEIPCFSSDEMLLSINSPDSVQYLWAHGDNKLITEGRIIPDADRRGTLKIIGITMADSDNYTCTVNFKDPDTQLLTTLSFIHKVMVVSPPNIALHTSIHYGVSSKAKCDREVLEMFELYLSQQVEDIICKSRKSDKIHICEVEIYNPMCRRNDYEENDVNSKLLWTLGKKTNNSQKDQSYFSMLFQRNKRYSSYLPVEKLLEGDELMKNTAVLSLSYQVLMKDIWGFITAINNRSHCSPFCQQKITLILIKIIKRSILSGLSYPVNFSKATIYIPDLSSINTKVIIACEGGLHLSEGFCVPCPKGHFSEEGSTECKKCPWGTYQDKIASIKCEACSHPLKEGCYEMMFAFSFYTILVSASIFLILFTCCYYFCCCRTSKTKMTEYTPVKLICEECPRVRNKKVLRENRSKKNLLSSEIEKDGCKNSFRVKGFNHFPQQRRL